MSELLILTIVIPIVGLITTFAMTFLLGRMGKGVHRENSTSFAANQDKVSAQVMRVLSRGQSGYRYTDTIVSEDGFLIDTRVKPTSWPLMLSTSMKIEIETVDGNCLLTVSTRSQKYIYGDGLSFYDGYIRDLLDSVGSRIEEI